ncbi:hypothetical protein BDR26DRAFT_874772 [Obelidium mucronatum]|nr:hypothetical protein BDR26DRAFT_874772 [Obelidium mucronatum]
MKFMNIWIITLASIGLASAACTNPTVRREWMQLSAAEKNGYIAAVKVTDFTATHAANAHWAHANAEFLVFHRAMLSLYEKALASAGWNGGLVYLDEGYYYDNWQDTTQTDLFSATYFGTQGTRGSCLRNGQFTSSFTDLAANGIRQCVQRCGDGDFWDSTLVASVLGSATTYDQLRGDDTSNYHGSGHISIGGTGCDMSDSLWSPRDPVFYLHHAYVDKIYWKWQQLCPTYKNSYNGNLASGSNPNNPLLGNSRPVNPNQPLDSWTGLTAGDMFDTNNDFLCYTYSKSPGDISYSAVRCPGGQAPNINPWAVSTTSKTTTSTTSRTSSTTSSNPTTTTSRTSSTTLTTSTTVTTSTTSTISTTTTPPRTSSTTLTTTTTSSSPLSTSTTASSTSTTLPTSSTTSTTTNPITTTSKTSTTSTSSTTAASTTKTTPSTSTSSRTTTSTTITKTKTSTTTTPDAITPCYTAWNPSGTYSVRGLLVSYKNVNYRTKWWAGPANIPDFVTLWSNTPWESLGPCRPAAVVKRERSISYTAQRVANGTVQVSVQCDDQALKQFLIPDGCTVHKVFCSHVSVKPVGFEHDPSRSMDQRQAFSACPMVVRSQICDKVTKYVRPAHLKAPTSSSKHKYPSTLTDEQIAARNLDWCGIRASDAKIMRLVDELNAKGL